MIASWYQTQPMCIKWGQLAQHILMLLIDVRQGGMLSPKMFAIYIDNLSLDIAMYKQIEVTLLYVYIYTSIYI